MNIRKFFRTLFDLPDWQDVVNQALLDHDKELRKLGARMMPHEAYLDAMPDKDTCIHCLKSVSEFCHDGYGRTVCKACKPLQYHNESVAGRAKGWQ